MVVILLSWCMESVQSVQRKRKGRVGMCRGTTVRKSHGSSTVRAKERRGKRWEGRRGARPWLTSLGQGLCVFPGDE